MSAEENKAIQRRIYEAYNQGDLAALDELIAPDNTSHEEAIPGQEPGLEGLKKVLTMFRSAIPDFAMTPDVMIAEGDKVAAHVVTQGTNTGEFMGNPPTGKEIKIESFHINRFADGKLVEHWGLSDTAKMMQQLGVAPPTGESEG